MDWEPDPVDGNVEDALAGPEPTAERTEREKAKDFLRELLADGPVEADEAKQQARKADISERTLHRAKAELGIVSKRDTFRGPWRWYPPKVGKAATSAYIGNGGYLGNLREPESLVEGEVWAL